MTDANPLLDTFVLESMSLIESATAALLALEKSPDEGALHETFRVVHTLKGSSLLLDIPPFTAAVHVAEELLVLARDGRATIGQTEIDQFLALMDQLSAWIAQLEREQALATDAETVSEKLQDDFRRILEQFRESSGETESKHEPPKQLNQAPKWFVELSQHFEVPEGTSGIICCVTYRPEEGCFFRGEDPLLLVRDAPGRWWADVVEVQPWPEGDAFDPLECNLEFRIVSTAPVEMLAEHFCFVLDECEFTTLLLGSTEVEASEDPFERDSSSPPTAPSLARKTVRVDQSRIDGIIDLVGELAVAKNALPFLADDVDSGGDRRQVANELRNQFALINRICSHLQDAAMQVRMVPLSSVLERFRRLVRDTARQLGKEATLNIVGAETEIDKNLVEDLSQPLTHLLRNSIDHGIEPADVRLAAGKPADGTVTIRAFSDNRRVFIEIEDDGKGIDVAALRAKAISEGLLDAATAEHMDDQTITRLIFRAGISTADSVSEISGRGVGMDAVQAALGRMAASISVQSQPGLGTKMTLALPVTMAVTQVMRIRVADQTFGIHIDAVVESTAVHRRQLHSMGDGALLNQRDGVMPLIDLRDYLGIGPSESTTQPESVTILIVHIDDKIAGLLVDALDAAVDVVIKPLEGVGLDVDLYSGTALLGDGRVMLILNLKDVIHDFEINSFDHSSIRHHHGGGKRGTAATLESVA